jgi:methionyl-tRNA formyltransferase
MRIIFAGSPEIAVPSLITLAEMEQEGGAIVLAGILTNADRRQGRHGHLVPTEVSAAAEALDSQRKKKGLLPIVQLKHEKLDERARKEISALAPDLLVSFAYGRLFGPRFLALFPLGGINIHPSLLPKYRGASPIPAVILALEKDTGICIQKLFAEMDSGDILACEKIELQGRETTSQLSEIVSQKAAILLRETLLDFHSRARNAGPQTAEPTYCGEIKKEAGLIDWDKSALLIDAQIRAYTPWPLSFTLKGKDLLFILEAEPFKAASSDASGQVVAVAGTVLGIDRNKGILIQTGDGVLAVSRLQKQTKKALDWKTFCNGERAFVGSKLGC